MTRTNRKPTPVDPAETPPGWVQPKTLNDQALLAALLGP